MNISGFYYANNMFVNLEIDNGLIKDIQWSKAIRYPDENDIYIAPGFIDNQVNGYKGVEFCSENLTVEKAVKTVKEFWKQGVTTILPTIITASHKQILKNLKILSEACKDAEISSSVAGIHLEGPYISPEDGYRGAHPLEYVRLPDWEEFQQYIDASEGRIRQISLAPELDGAIPFIEKCVERGIVVGLAHHNASAGVIKKAVAAGASVSTHLGNGCANEINRRENVFWPQLAEDRLTASMICDGFHLTPEQILTFYKVKGPRRLILTSDIVHLAGLNPGVYDYSGEKVELTKDGMIIIPRTKIFAGASLPLYRGIEHMMISAGCSLKEAVDMASFNQARLLGLNDRGEFLTGKRADFVSFTLMDKKIKIKETIKDGKVVFSTGS